MIERHRHRKLASVAALAALGTAVLAGSPPAHAAGELNLYNWGDYINPEILKIFEEETGITVRLDTYGSNEEMLAKIQAGATGYDIVFPSAHMQDIMHHLGLLAETGINEAKGFENIDPAFLRADTDPEGRYCLPYAWGTVGIFYNKTRVPEVKSWADFFAIPETTGGEIILLDDMRETIAIGLIVNGHSVNTTDPNELKEAEEFLISKKPRVSSFTYDSVPLVQSGDVAAAHYFVGAMMYVREDPENLAYVIPEEGATMYQENMCVLASAPNKENARKFMEFYLRPEIVAANVAQQMNSTPNLAAQELLPDELKNNPNTNPPPEVRERLQIFRDLGRDLRTYDRAWTRIRTAQ
ncbi:spermidine/putrescine ABC transporter substrate-binding protein [Arenibaculum sp.]|jgi:spermidine/putrescine transport system substrate-binding protein|uniref:polyamine ABC transporter substrate-binding protein n=1 Tax=Arenibaculum sp. TaxID=2865862 RepID=UPI002E133DF1|nr:spermidine/putrescine ABC transporter substrate-binding protein [Arenibaculum sp.]